MFQCHSSNCLKSFLFLKSVNLDLKLWLLLAMIQFVLQFISFRPWKFSLWVSNKMELSLNKLCLSGQIKNIATLQEKVINCRCSIDDICTKCTNRCKGITLCTKFIKRSNQKSAFQIHYSAKLELEYYKVINF